MSGPAGRPRVARAGSLFPALYFAGVTMLFAWPVLLGRSTTALTRVVQGTPAEVALEPIGGAYLPNLGAEWTRLDLAERLGVTHVYAPSGVSLTDSVYAGSVAVLEQDRSSLELPETDEDRGGPPGKVMRAERGYDEAQVTVKAEQGAWLVLPIGYAPGWRAEMDGEPLAIRPADFARSAVRVPSGAHTITFSYRPVGLRVGLSMTLVALAAGLILLVRSLVRGHGVLAARTTSTQSVT